MSLLRGSSHYVWNTSSMLGKGATGIVYRGMHRSTGEAAAVKTFNHNSRSRPVNHLQMREFEVLKKLNHDNIVKLLAMEEEAETHKKVLVMELCSGGSLYNILEDPQNNYGLDESEFLIVLRDLSSGMKYLRDNNMVHRDLKPGNIMKFITEDGKSVYKLIDFGGARELEENQPFMSLHGTEEYLHPDLYEKAVLKRPSQKLFRATVDLWSIGVTLYHVATGSLPFRPYGGRMNTETMHFIISRKISGVISGVQHTEKGPIEWSQELPKTCLLNQGLRKLVVTMLAGILEGSDKMWTFENFFDCATDIVSRKAIHIFYVNEGREISLYMQPNKTMKDVREQIDIQLKVPQANQMLVCDKVVSPTTKITAFPETSCDHPLILLHNENTVVKDLTRFGALSACFPKFDTASVDIDRDAALAKSCCSVAHAVKRLVEKLVRCRQLLLSTPKLLLKLIFENVTKLSHNFDVLKQRVEDLDQRFSRLEKCSSLVTELLSCWPSEHKCEKELWQLAQLVFEKKEPKDLISKEVLSLRSAVHTLKERVLCDSTLKKEWDQAIHDCPELTGCAEKADTFVHRIRDSWQLLVKDKSLRDRNGRTLSYYDEQLHVLEKVKVQQSSEKLLALVQENCLKACCHALGSLDNWYSDMQATMVQYKCVNEVLMSVTELIQCHSTHLQEAEAKSDDVCQIIKSQLNASKELPTSTEQKSLDSSRPQSGKISFAQKNSKIIVKLQSFSESHSSLKSLVDENDFLIERLIHERDRLRDMTSE